MGTDESYCFLRHAERFLKAAKQLSPKSEEELPVANYLLGHSIQLSLKAFLLAKKGCTITDLRKYGHNLETLLKEAARRKLGREIKLTLTEKEAIILLNKHYEKKEMDCPEHEKYSLPKYEKIFKIADRLIKKISSYAHN